MNARKPALIFNHNKAAFPMQALTCNLLPSNCRHDTMEGKDYVVVPMVMMTVGVHSGSGGPLLYTEEELSKTPAAWNYKPIVVYHPERNGQGVSACTPEIIDTRKIGVMMNTTYDNGRLKSEAWIEKSKANLVDSRIMEAIEKNEVMELSTGVFVDQEKTPGEWNGEAYNGIARNFRPDHLALLPDQIGACSIKDGAGLLRNAAKRKDPKALRSAFDTLYKNALVEMGLAKDLIQNELSHETIRSNLRMALEQRYGVNPQTGPYLYLDDVFDTNVIYEWGGKLFRLDYSTTKTGVVLSNEAPVEVKRVTEYQAVQNKQQKPHMDKKAVVDGIIANTKSGWKETDRETLMGLSETQLTVIVNGLKEAPAPGAAQPAQNKEEPKSAPSTAATTTSAVPAVTQNKVVTIDEYIGQAPPEIQEVLRNGNDALKEEKAKLVATITANKSNPFSADELNKKPIVELRGIAKLAASQTTPTQQPVVNYAGQGPVPQIVNNSEEPLSMPVMNWGK